MVPLRSGLSGLSVKRVNCKEFLLALRAFTACWAVLLGSNGELACVAVKASLIEMGRRRSQDGGGVGQGEHFLPYKFIKRAFKRRVNSTKQLLNAGRGHQAPRKATQFFERR